MLAGFFRTLATIFLVWFVFRWLDRVFGGSRRKRQFDAGRPPRSGRQETARRSEAKPLAHLIIDVDCSGSMGMDLPQVKGDIEKVLTRGEFDNPDLETSLVSWASNGDCIVHWSHVTVRDIMVASSMTIRRAIGRTALQL